MGARTWSGRGKAEFEKFFDTGGPIEWDEPSYSVFDPDGGMKRLADHMEGKPALLMFLQEERTGVVTAHLTPGAQCERAGVGVRQEDRQVGVSPRYGSKGRWPGADIRGFPFSVAFDGDGDHGAYISR
ncbi:MULTISPECIES: putative antirestriction adenine methyltransferase [Streptomyces violaceoruber group]|uniref:putative antirestriction adenine methyltransferase n=1 Tax=Streptomyces violaceoruber group TaxID=2867121 RepID=UPI002DD7A309|nr:hypothetical protein [Streptomyces anthocyanicus]WSB66438.1 hypothetical protein OIE72_39545 [Streptomyces anthocyanicus]